MISRILVCAANSRERDYWLALAAKDGAEQVSNQPYRALFPALELELRIEIFERSSDADRVRGLELAGVLNFGAVRDEQCRSMIIARIRP
jgi:hypothetical protein